MNKTNVWVIKDEEGILRPQAGIWMADGMIGKINKEIWDKKLHKSFKECTLVRAVVVEEDNLQN